MVNPGEGFNLRRDVFMRIAVMVKQLNEKSDKVYTLVLPPWTRLYHWQTRELGDQSKIPWSLFFDVPSIRRFVPVIDYEQYAEIASPIIDQVYILQGYKEGWQSGKFEEKVDFRDCLDQVHLRQEEDGTYSNLREYELVRARDYKCVSVLGTTAIVHGVIEDAAKTMKSVLLDRAENLLHNHFGDQNYWAVRRSMRFANHLVSLANEFRQTQLNSTDEADKTVRSPRWEDFQPERGTPLGGPYIAVHFRRRDYLYAKKNRVPSLEWAAKQLEKKLETYKLKTVFVATDAPHSEFVELQNHLEGYNVIRFTPTKEIHERYKDGGVAIIDQIIASHARYFLGSTDSTFSFRIQEEREILGFPTEKTFEILCPEGKFDCEKGSVWKIVYPPSDKKREEL